MKIGAIYGSQVASGSMATTVASHNAGGLYIRSRSIPVQPNSAQQAAVKGRMVNLSAKWGLLTTDQRNDWVNYAEVVSKTNSIGATIYVSGRNWFIGNNSVRLAAGLPVVSNGPQTLSLAQLSAPTLAVSSATSGSMTIQNTDAWANATGGGLLVFVSRGCPPQRSFFKGPYRFATLIAGAASAPTSPATIPLPFRVGNGQKVFFRAVAAEADGRISAEVTGFCVAAVS